MQIDVLVLLWEQVKADIIMIIMIMMIILIMRIMIPNTVQDENAMLCFINVLGLGVICIFVIHMFVIYMVGVIYIFGGLV